MITEKPVSKPDWNDSDDEPLFTYLRKEKLRFTENSKWRLEVPTYSKTHNACDAVRNRADDFAKNMNCHKTS